MFCNIILQHDFFLKESICSNYSYFTVLKIAKEFAGKKQMFIDSRKSRILQKAHNNAVNTLLQQTDKHQISDRQIDKQLIECSQICNKVDTGNRHTADRQLAQCRLTTYSFSCLDRHQTYMRYQIAERHSTDRDQTENNTRGHIAYSKQRADKLKRTSY